jgi:predicted SAM-dependent methyltransferase
MARPLHRKLRAAIRYRFFVPLGRMWSRTLGWAKHNIWRRWVSFRAESPLRLHVGCGREALEGWVNIDIQTYAEADVALDITQGIPYHDVELIYSEHTLEHLDVESALQFLVESNRVLLEEGWLRLTTPNLDWVWDNIYSSQPGPNRLEKAIWANRSFYGWGHRFLWNREALEAALRAAGFSEIRWCEYGHSDRPELDGLERHQKHPDQSDCPHVLVVEARRGELDPKRLQSFRGLLQKEFLDQVADR